MAPKIEKVNVPLSKLGEGPHWDHVQQSLFYVNIMENILNKYIPSKDLHTQTKVDFAVSFIIPVEGRADHYVVGSDHKILVVRWDGNNGSTVTVVEEVAELDADHPNNKINDAKADSRGRLMTGTISMKGQELARENGSGSLFSVSGEGQVKVLGGGVCCSNGIAWASGERRMYHADTMPCIVNQYDYDVTTGDATFVKVLLDCKKSNITGYPDGMTIDTEDNLWIACFNGGCVVRVDSRSGEVLQKVQMPRTQITSCTFGGPDLDVLYVVTGSFDFDAEKAPPGGELFAVTGLGVRGRPNLPFKWSPKKK